MFCYLYDDRLMEILGKGIL